MSLEKVAVTPVLYPITVGRSDSDKRGDVAARRWRYRKSASSESRNVHAPTNIECARALHHSKTSNVVISSILHTTRHALVID